ncbi:MAG: hypothetical protein KF802_02540 [Bdellovibrionaceae bacterium]|nr:hypothetical protein [Pseudobdellovibrionaceae bacterium]
MKTKVKKPNKKTVKATKPISVKEAPEEIPKTIREQIEKDFFKLVLKVPYETPSKDKTLADYVPKEYQGKWTSAYTQIFMDDIYMKMNMQVPTSLKNKKVVEILDYLEKQRRNTIRYGR